MSAAPIRGGFFNQQMEKCVIGCGYCPAKARLGWPLRFLVEQEKSLLQQVAGKGHLHPAWLSKVGPVRGEIEIWLQPPTIVNLKLVVKRARDSSGNIRDPGVCAGAGREKDAKEDRRFTVLIRSQAIPHVSDFSDIKPLHRLRDGLLKLRLIDESSGKVSHVSIMAHGASLLAIPAAVVGLCVREALSHD